MNTVTCFEGILYLKEVERYQIKGTSVNGCWFPFDIKVIINKYKLEKRNYTIIH